MHSIPFHSVKGAILKEGERRTRFAPSPFSPVFSKGLMPFSIVLLLLLLLLILFALILLAEKKKKTAPGPALALLDCSITDDGICLIVSFYLLLDTVYKTVSASSSTSPAGSRIVSATKGEGEPA